MEVAAHIPIHLMAGIVKRIAAASSQHAHTPSERRFPIGIAFKNATAL
jgi:hypothetical protein